MALKVTLAQVKGWRSKKCRILTKKNLLSGPRNSLDHHHQSAIIWNSGPCLRANSEGDQIRHQRYIKRACAEFRLQPVCVPKDPVPSYETLRKVKWVVEVNRR
ncbi:hypothetical protein C8J57DRAFT_1234271 [Mycena rebaudengoi]|nr:hypothetical protein C8J57DRAFT_1234271 [Mycena rebaudengoi]